MAFDDSVIRAIHSFRMTFLRLMYTSDITRQQLIFLTFLIQTGHTKDFTVRSVMIKGLSWQLAYQFLKYLRRIGYTTKRGRLWSITDKGLEYHSRFMKEFNRIHEGPFSWR